MIVTDASVWVSHLSDQESHHLMSRRWLSTLVQTKTVIIAPALLLAEVGGAVARRTGDSKLGNQAVNHILSTPNLRLVYTNSELAMSAAKLAVSQLLRGADSIYVAIAWQYKIPLVTWDNEQIDRTQEIITSYTPADAT
jgi:predicted nucleic acid-binding protein